MGRILGLFLALVFAGSAMAAVPGPSPMLTIAASGSQTQGLSIPLSCLTGSAGSGCPGAVFSLYMGQNATTQDFYILYGGPGGTGTYSSSGQAYRVTTGKTAYCVNMTAAGGAVNPFQLISATASFSNGAASVTGGVYQCGASGNTICNYVGQTASLPAVVPGTYTFGAGTFAGVQVNNSIVYNIHLDCFEN